MHSDDVSPWLIRGIYLFGLALVLHAVIDLSTTVWPLRPSEITWRYGLLGLAAGYLQTPMLGLLLVAGTAMWTENHTLLRVVGLVMLGLGAILLPTAALFMLDVVQIRGLRADEMQDAVLYGGAFQTVKYLLAAVIFVLLGHGALKTAQTARSHAPTGLSGRGVVMTGGKDAGGRKSGD